jgi:hypothetical protein
VELDLGEVEDLAKVVAVATKVYYDARRRIRASKRVESEGGTKVTLGEVAGIVAAEVPKVEAVILDLVKDLVA